MLAKIHNKEHQHHPSIAVRCSCQNSMPSKWRLRIEGVANDDDHLPETTPVDGDDPTYAPTLDANFSMNHMPFRSKRSKRATRNRRSARDKTQLTKPANLVDLTGERDRETRRPSRGRSKSLDGVVHESELLCMNAEKIPKTFNLAFDPTRCMDLAGVGLAVATYIFSKDLPRGIEILADVGHCVTDRTLLTLVPNERVMDNVITVVITMLSKTSSSHHWFMPTMIMGINYLLITNLDAVVSNHMKYKVDKVIEIFQPIWTDGHWYLMVVDLRRQKLVYFDSLKCTRETESKKLSMTHVALHLESLTIGPKWLSKSTMERPRFSLFKYEEPFVPQQHRLS
ncbi:hypothetical protein Ahy_B03g063418 [Arachis hypogaea]|uniref:Ubiquitin-like protease family profile domain-containing protein n=1 Tax=Arachis hypogaea TaxID=3818 RepID=A0A444ZXD1_ARAHY|nr:hypothetical protein Ahy_B03g063418 [Arachis hypogaea]